MGDEETIHLGKFEEKRVLVLNRLLEGVVTTEQAAILLGRSPRQVKRLKAVYRRDGPRALVHGNRGRRPAHATPPEVAARVVELAQGKYAGFNDAHLTEKLVESEHLAVTRSTVRRILRQAGVSSPHRRRAPRHRRRRERMAQAGMLLQADASRHRWLGPDGPYLTLVGGIDDATGMVPWALFRAQEDAAGYLEWLREVAVRTGLPLALYVDQHSIFKTTGRERLTLQEEFTGQRQPTQFGRALQELGIQPIYALSPQAKGRIERLWRTFQDRLVSELRLAEARTLDEANRVLWAWLPRFNAQFTVPTADPSLTWRPLPESLDPEQVFCFKYVRVVAADNTVRFGEHRLQLLATPQRASYARVEVELHERLDGSLAVLFGGRVLTTTPAPLEAPTLRARSLPRPATRPASTPPSTRPAAPAGPPSGGRRPPAPDHPWRRAFLATPQTDSLPSRPFVLPSPPDLPRPAVGE